MGSILSVIFSVISPSLAEQAKYIYELGGNLKALINAIVELEAKSHDVQTKVKIQERQGLQPLADVLLWLARVEAIGPKVCRLLEVRSVELERLFMCGFCSKDFGFTYPYGKKVFKTLKKVEHLLSSRPGEVVARRGLPPPKLEGSTRHTVGLEEMLESTWEYLKKDEVGILGLYGMGGVGKTTLLEQINNKYFETRDNFYVIYVVVSQDLQIGMIQNEIGKRLGIYYVKWEQEKTKKEKASDINKVLRKNMFVLLLDDMWRGVDLEDIGVPSPSIENRSKVVFTTRSKVVCRHMGAHVEMEVELLEPESAWKLFEEKVGANTLASDPKIPELARIVCEKCKGLPLALTAIGKTMACKRTLIEWQHAKYPEADDNIFQILKLSYDYLNGETIKQCFQYCALFPDDHKINKHLLVGYWICEGIIDDIRQGFEIINILDNACLLINDEHEEEVTMHDVVRQMAMWIASNFGEEKENFVVKSGAGLHQIPEVRDWNAVRRMSLYNNDIRNISVTPKCFNLKTLILRQNKLENISSEFFLLMPKLVVLDLSDNGHLSKLREEVSNLLSLRYLGLARTRLKNLPAGLTKLIQLRHLDLSSSATHSNISVISSLENLETLLLYGSTRLTLELIDDIKSLKYLKVLSVRINDFVVLERLLSISRLARCIEGIFLEGIKVRNVSFAMVTARLISLTIEECSIADLNGGYMRFQNLECVSLWNVSGIQDLTWLLFAPCLKDLSVVGLGQTLELKEIISRGKVSGIVKEKGLSMRPFANLRRLWLEGLEELNSIYWEPLDFPKLRSISIKKCPNLKKLTLNTESANGKYNFLIVDKQEWLDKVEWEDDATKWRFWYWAEVINRW